jgi:hypothetical protein
MNNNIKTTDQVPDRVSALYETYKKLQQFWFFLHYSAGVIAVIAGVLAAAAGANSGPEFVQSNAWIWGLLAALLSGIVTFLGPLQKAEAYKHAYYLLANSLTRFEAGILSMGALLDDYEHAQSIVLLGDPKASNRRNEI